MKSDSSIVNVGPLFTSGILLPEKYLLLVASYFNYKVIVYVFELAYILIVCHIMHLFIHNHPNTSDTFYDLLLFQFTQVWRDVARDSIFV
jgi:hypothetical protein